MKKRSHFKAESIYLYTEVNSTSINRIDDINCNEQNLKSIPKTGDSYVK